MLGPAARLPVRADERLSLGQLVDDDETLVRLDHGLHLGRLVAGGEREAVVVRPHALVLRNGQPDALAATVPAALAVELDETAVGRDPLRLDVLRELLDAVVHLAKEALVAGGPLEPLLHGVSLRRYRRSVSSPSRSSSSSA